MVRLRVAHDGSQTGEATLVRHPVVLIDLGQTWLRTPEITDELWEENKRHEDEEGCVGYNLRKLVNEVIGEGFWTYTPSYHW